MWVCSSSLPELGKVGYTAQLEPRLGSRRWRSSAQAERLRADLKAIGKTFTVPQLIAGAEILCAIDEALFERD